MYFNVLLIQLHNWMALPPLSILKKGQILFFYSSMKQRKFKSSSLVPSRNTRTLHDNE